TAMTSNFFLNNILTYRDMRLHGWGLLRGWCSFILACSLGALANVGIATYLFELQTSWMSSAVAGGVVGGVWDFFVAALFFLGKGKCRLRKVFFLFLCCGICFFSYRHS